ncbi:unnamed protein product [Echinostoma caproni]|uniref:DUF4371 domain-containing protein n=1 Tax=Echinostoma caproni TaxID=27848 RepID=A0A183B891_9TREM|nr:unnamed protein product [Echinostoma caproni]
MDVDGIVTMETKVIACLKASLDNEAFVNLVKLLALNRIANGRKKLFQSQYSACLSYGYQFIKGPAYAAQSEEHAENARRYLLSHASEPAEIDVDKVSDRVHPRTIMLIILLTYYTLARAKLLLNK